jgi:hypothetical protein
MSHNLADLRAKIQVELFALRTIDPEGEWRNVPDVQQFEQSSYELTGIGLRNLYSFLSEHRVNLVKDRQRERYRQTSLFDCSEENV